MNLEVGVLIAEDIERAVEMQLFRLERRHIRDASNPFEIPDTVFKSLYRIPKQLAINLIAELEVFMVETVRSTSVPNALKVLCALHFYAHGSYQKSVGQDFFLGLSQTTVSRCIESVSEIISGQLSRRYLKFPRGEDSQLTLKRRFMEKYHFPGVIGCIDCTHVAVIAPPLEHPQYPGYAYLNRKGYYSINVQIICDANLSILNCNAMYPGSTHDAAIWQMSTVQRYLRENHVRGTWLLGDSGYPLQPWLLTPIENAAEDSPEDEEMNMEDNGYDYPDIPNNADIQDGEILAAGRRARAQLIRNHFTR
ncbi:hypothetical protein RN001_013667 [Aquatica leii]|uniref:Putative nuclease HARBI1 n=1 Tax=Aquatica leii TaxID=1421715 RepID=A0AAN7SCH7_9COLE|nr:hypothetical protein RN001_013667 [Aquatica leii]